MTQPAKPPLQPNSTTRSPSESGAKQSFQLSAPAIALPEGGAAIVGNSLAIWKVKTYLRKVALTDTHVLITGETGTGKELAAQYIHRHSTRHSKPLVTLNCAALPDGLIESELFGYERGAFTGAVSSYAGKLKLAEGGTVLFDEIGDMSLYAQAKILRLIETKEVYPLGGRRSVPLNVRIIAATNRDLERQVAKGEFRQDLFYRLNVARVTLPPLRERKDDIPALIDHYVQTYTARSGRAIEGFGDEAMSSLSGYEWPGNVRELMNFVERIFIDPPSEKIGVADLPESMRSLLSTRQDTVPAERELLLHTLAQTHWNKSQAAERLHWSRMTLYRKLAKYHLVERQPDQAFPAPKQHCNNCKVTVTK